MRLTIRSGEHAGRSIDLRGRVFLIGRESSCDLTFDDTRISRRHASVEVLGADTVRLRDLASTNGTFVDGSRIDGAVSLRIGQSFRVGSVVLVLQADPPSSRDNGPGSVRTAPTDAVRERSKRTPVVTAIGIIIVAVVLLLFATGVLPPDDGEPTVEDVVADVRPSTVAVTALIDGRPTGGGTGWVLNADDGLVVTNHHVVNAGNEWEVSVDDHPRKAELVGTAPCEDLAALRVRETGGLVTLPLGSQQNLDQGQMVVALGFPVSASPEGELTATTGVVSVVETRFRLGAYDVPEYPNVIQTTAAINPGNSGGPLVDLDSRLVGVNSAGITLIGGRIIEGLGYAIGVDRVMRVVPDLADGHSMDWTGLLLESPTSIEDFERLDLPVRRGMLALGAVEGTPADEAGFSETVAAVVAIDGEPMDGSVPAYCDAVNGKTEADFEVVIPGSRATREVRLEFVD